MKTQILKSVLFSFLLMLFCSFVSAQSNTISFSLEITDDCQSSGTYFQAAAYVERTPSPDYCKWTQLTPTYLIEGPNSVSFDCSVPIDTENEIYRIHVVVQNGNNESCQGVGRSGWLTSDDLYGVSLGTIYVTTTD